MKELGIGDKFYTILDGDYWGYIIVTDISDMTVCWEEYNLDDKPLRCKCWGKSPFLRSYTGTKQYSKAMYKQANELAAKLQCKSDLGESE